MDLRYDTVPGEQLLANEPGRGDAAVAVLGHELFEEDREAIRDRGIAVVGGVFVSRVTWARGPVDPGHAAVGPG